MSGPNTFKKPGPPPPNPFKIDSSTKIEDWKKWIISFRWYANSINLDQKSHDVQLSTFKSLVGPDALEIYNTFSILDITDVESVIRKFEEHFKPKCNVTLERYKLYKLKQKAGQRFDDFLSDITNQVDKCEFQSMRNEVILYKIVGGIDNDEIRNALLADSDLKYDRAVQICRASSAMHFMSGKENDCKGSAVGRKREFGKTPKVSYKEQRRSLLESTKKNKEIDSEAKVKPPKPVRKVCESKNSTLVDLLTSTTMDKKEDTCTEGSLEQNAIESSESKEIAASASPVDNAGNDGSDSDWRADDDDRNDDDYEPDDESQVKPGARKSRVRSSSKRGKRRKKKRSSSEHTTKLRNLPCEICGKVIGSELALERHRSIHEFGQKGTCFYCKKQFSKDFLRRHMTGLHYDILGCPPPKLFSCDVCDFKTRFGENLRRHKFQHSGEKPLACEHCEYRCITPRLLRAHIAKLHTGERPFSCSFCQRGFLHSDAMKRHMLTHMTPEEKEKHRERIKEAITCEVCGKAFSSKAALKTHSIRHTGEKPFACHKCEFRTVTNGALNSHIVTMHSDEKPFVCSVCGYSCKQRSTLQQHMITHSDEKPYSCQVCSRKFAQSSHLKRHMLTHTGDKPHVCEICGHRWTTRGNLKSHMKVHEKHSGDPSQHPPARKRQKKPQPGTNPAVIVATTAVQSDESGHSEHAAADAIIQWSEQVSAINSMEYTPSLETPPPFHPTYPVHQSNPRPPDCRYYQQRHWQNHNYRQDQNQGQ